MFEGACSGASAASNLYMRAKLFGNTIVSAALMKPIS
jgi:hypothetical protein